MQDKAKKLALKDREIPVMTVALIGERSDTVDVMHDVSMGPDLDRELTRQPALFAWYIKLAEEAKDQERRAERDYDRISEDVWAEVDEKSKAVEGRGPTVEAKKNEVARDKRVRKAYDKLLEAQHLAGLLTGYVKVFDQRGGMLQSLTKSRTAELEKLDLSSRGSRIMKRHRETEE